MKKCSSKKIACVTTTNIRLLDNYNLVCRSYHDLGALLRVQQDIDHLLKDVDALSVKMNTGIFTQSDRSYAALVRQRLSRSLAEERRLLSRCHKYE